LGKEIKDDTGGKKQFTRRNLEFTPAGTTRAFATDRFDPVFTLLI
jgi:hypothetical protein